MHFVWHIALCAGYCNPRIMWCYVDEDFMRIGKVIRKITLSRKFCGVYVNVQKAIAEASVVGTPAVQVGKKVTERWHSGCVHELSHLP